MTPNIAISWNQTIIANKHRTQQRLYLIQKLQSSMASCLNQNPKFLLEQSNRCALKNSLTGQWTGALPEIPQLTDFSSLLYLESAWPYP